MEFAKVKEGVCVCVCVCVCARARAGAGGGPGGADRPWTYVPRQKEELDVSEHMKEKKPRLTGTREAP